MESKDLQPKDDVPEERLSGNEEVKKYAFISMRALEADHIGYCYRDEPENNIDSGWRFLYGDEDEDYLDNPDNCRTVYPEEMISINPALEIVLSSSIGSEFVWHEEQEAYIEML